MKPRVTIIYCPKCNWLLRAAYMAQELLTTFSSDLKSVTLEPASVNGQFSILVEDEIIFDRKTNGGFTDIKEIKQKIRDIVNPGKDLGHSDKRASGSSSGS